MSEKLNVWVTLTSVTFVSMCTYLSIDYKIFFLYIMLMCFDFTTWVIKWFLNKDLQSVIAINWVFKKLVLILLIFSIWATWKIIGYEDLSWLLSFSFATLWIAEFYSILWNIYEIKTGKKTKEFDWVAFLISWLLKFIEDKIKKLDINKNGNKENK
jgi:hypothetical protein